MKCLYCKGSKESMQMILCDRCDKNIPSEHKYKMQRKYLKDKDRLKAYLKDKYSKGGKR